ncbi:hypothetical protein ACFXPI_16570 [Streptomyces sp. NPDC059104]|uniref:hypothetical protein n=1 Tax=Streptomyces sp. NPDC059104 TaxID=3346729 RepID=UPI0036A15A8F
MCGTQLLAAARLPESLGDVLLAAAPEFVGSLAAAVVLGLGAWGWRRVVRRAGRQERE